MEATHITSKPRSGKLGMLNEEDDDENDLQLFFLIVFKNEDERVYLSCVRSKVHHSMEVRHCV